MKNKVSVASKKQPKTPSAKVFTEVSKRESNILLDIIDRFNQAHQNGNRKLVQHEIDIIERQFRSMGDFDLFFQKSGKVKKRFQSLSKNEKQLIHILFFEKDRLLKRMSSLTGFEPLELVAFLMKGKDRFIDDLLRKMKNILEEEDTSEEEIRILTDEKGTEWNSILSQPQVLELYDRIIQIKNIIAVTNLELISSLAAKFNNNPSNIHRHEDYLSTGYMGLNKAILRFDITRGLQLSTYATPWIKSFMGREYECNEHLIRIPSYIRLARNKMRALQKKNPKIDHATLVKELDTTPEKLQNIMSCSTVVTLEDSHGLMRDKEQESPPENNAGNELYEYLDLLTAKHKKVIALRYGLNGYKEHTLQEVGKLFKLSRERIRQLEKAGIQKLQWLMREKDEEDSL